MSEHAIARSGGYLHWKVENSVRRVLVGAGVCRVAVIDFSHGIDTGSLVEGGGRNLVDVLDCVNAQAINWRVVS